MTEKEALLLALANRPSIEEFGLSGTKFKTNALTQGELARLDLAENKEDLWCEFLQKRVQSEGVSITAQWLLDEFDQFELLVMFTFLRHRQLTLTSARDAASGILNSPDRIIEFYNAKFDARNAEVAAVERPERPASRAAKKPKRRA
jgi:hypothetical protein